jgi:alkylation response protein AidB-like acyl-CoA dehydrogenase
MRFGTTPEQDAFAATLGRLLSAADTPKIVRQWGAGEFDPGLELWARLAEQGVSALRVPERFGGLGASCVDSSAAFGQLGYHAVPGPWIETAIVAPVLLCATDDGDSLAAVAEGQRRVTLSIPPMTPYALDVAAADTVLLLQGRALHSAIAENRLTSLDSARHLSELRAKTLITELDPAVAAGAFNQGSVACAAQLLGIAQRLLDDAVSYAKSRSQFGRPIGEFQAIKHLLADVRIAIDFVRPLVQGAALSLDDSAPDVDRDVSAAKVAANEAALLAARTALQVHGAIGYTQEFDLSLWLTRARALTGSWGTSAWHRRRVLHALTNAESGRSSE